MKAAGLLLALLIAAVTAANEPPDLERLLEEKNRTRAADRAAWADYAFHRHVTRRSLDRDGNVTFLQEMHFRVTPAVGGFDEELFEIDGREPTARAIRHHRRKARFTKHYADSAELELANPVGEDLDLNAILEGDAAEVEYLPVQRIPVRSNSWGVKRSPGLGIQVSFWVSIILGL